MHQLRAWWLATWANFTDDLAADSRQWRYLLIDVAWRLTKPLRRPKGKK